MGFISDSMLCQHVAMVRNRPQSPVFSGIYGLKNWRIRKLSYIKFSNGIQIIWIYYSLSNQNSRHFIPLLQCLEDFDENRWAFALCLCGHFIYILPWLKPPTFYDCMRFWWEGNLLWDCDFILKPTESIHIIIEFHNIHCLSYPAPTWPVRTDEAEPEIVTCAIIGGTCCGERQGMHVTEVTWVHGIHCILRSCRICADCN